MPDADQRLLSALLAFVAKHPDPVMGRFKEAVAAWGAGAEDGSWQAVEPAHLPAADFLGQTLSSATDETRPLLALFYDERASRKWEQSYKKIDRLVGDDMLAGYGFAEVIGKWGPFVSHRVRSGIGVWGPDIDYPLHRHQADEVYLVLAGSADFTVGEAVLADQAAGATVHVPSLSTHGFSSGPEGVVVFYIWQDGDLRETSRFS